MNEKILFVDDEEDVLNAFQRQLHKRFLISTATSGQLAMQLMEKEGPFAVIVSDMRMPGMDGLRFLREAQRLCPDSVRLMLTGNVDQQTAIDAVNEGNVFRFINKPCSSELMQNSIEAALRQYKLVTAEKEILQKTLGGSIHLLMDILSLVAPAHPDGDIYLRKSAKAVAKTMGISNDWEIELAAMLSHIADVTLPPETLEKVRLNKELDEEERTIVEQLPVATHDLLIKIPRLNRVALIVRYQFKNFDGTGLPPDPVSGTDIPLESRILKVLHDLQLLKKTDHIESEQALEIMQQQSDQYDPAVVAAVINYVVADGSPESRSFFETMIADISPGQVLQSDIETVDNQVLFKSGAHLTDAMVQRLKNFHQTHRIKEPISVSSTTA